MHAMNASQAPTGAVNPAFSAHPGYRRMFAANQLTLGIFLPLRAYDGDMRVLTGQADLVTEIDRRGFAAVWVRDVPLFDPSFGDAGQVFDPFTYLSFLAARTTRIALATGSAIFSLRHPIDLAKGAATIDRLSGGRLVMGIASGDRPIEFPAYGLSHASRGERFAHAVAYFRKLMRSGNLTIESPLGSFDGAELLPKATTGAVPLIVTGASGQSLTWIAEHADGWLTYPGDSHTGAGPLRLAEKIRAWRALIPDGGFRPHMTNEWIDLVDDPDHPRTPLRGGFILRTGRNGLIALLNEWREAGVNHVALGIQFSQRPAAEIIQELAEEVLPHFPSHDGPAAITTAW
ncbi:LLM class oxidoreductase [Burkholderia sp. HI2500]|uniref:LLM class oxidoreductase n=2 Tax=Burkholderia TaxID=32008 RepID=UPI00359C340B